MFEFIIAKRQQRRLPLHYLSLFSRGSTRLRFILAVTGVVRPKRNRVFARFTFAYTCVFIHRKIYSICLLSYSRAREIVNNFPYIVIVNHTIYSFNWFTKQTNKTELVNMILMIFMFCRIFSDVQWYILKHFWWKMCFETILIPYLSMVATIFPFSLVH